MNSFCRDKQTADILNEFYNVDYYVLLENENDMYFWSNLFNKYFSSKEIKYSSVATCPLFDKLERGYKSLEKIENELDSNSNNITFLIARDSDLNILFNNNQFSKRTIATYGYAIENTLFCPMRLSQIICEDVPLNYDQLQSIATDLSVWYESISLQLNDFLVATVAADLYKKSEKANVPAVMGSTSNRFHLNGVLRNDEILKLIIPVKEIVPYEYFVQAKNLILSSQYKKRFIISGHFWESLVENKLKDYIKFKKQELINLNPDDEDLSPNYNITCKEILKRSSDKCLNRCQNSQSCEDLNYLDNQFKSLMIHLGLN